MPPEDWPRLGPNACVDEPEPVEPSVQQGQPGYVAGMLRNLNGADPGAAAAAAYRQARSSGDTAGDGGSVAQSVAPGTVLGGASGSTIRLNPDLGGGSMRGNYISHLPDTFAEFSAQQTMLGQQVRRYLAAVKAGQDATVAFLADYALQGVEQILSLIHI